MEKLLLHNVIIYAAGFINLFAFKVISTGVHFNA